MEERPAMTIFGDFITGITFCDAARKGWKEITNTTMPETLKAGDEFWSALQKQADGYSYSETRVGLAFRAGRCGFHAFLDMAGEEVGLRTAEYRLHPVQKRLEIGFETLTRWVKGCGFDHLSIDMQNGYSVQFVEPLSEVQRGYLMGFFQEFFEWASQGRIYPLIQKDIKGFCFATQPLNL
jgi:hypothetical protein